MDAKQTDHRHASTSCRFNPRARDGREPIAKTMGYSLEVSIHAPVMDANRVRLCLPSCVSIHAPVMDANSVVNEPWYNSEFQSTRP